MEEKKSKHLECTVTEEGVTKFLLIFDGNEDILPSYDENGEEKGGDDEYFIVDCSRKIGDVEEPIFYSIRDTIDFKKYALEILRESEYVVCDADYLRGNKIILKIRNNFAVSKGYTVEIDHDLGEGSKKGKEIEDICIQHQLDVDVDWRTKDLTSEDYKAL